MPRKVIVAIAATIMLTGTALADPIEGNWKTQSSETAVIGSCGGEFCITVKTGKYAGQTIGKMAAGGDGNNSGSITKPQNGKSYSGKASLTGNSLKMSGCVLGGLICENQIWNRAVGQ